MHASLAAGSNRFSFLVQYGRSYGNRLTNNGLSGYYFPEISGCSKQLQCGLSLPNVFADPYRHRTTAQYPELHRSNGGERHVPRNYPGRRDQQSPRKPLAEFIVKEL